jgi:hypothetical protein
VERRKEKRGKNFEEEEEEEEDVAQEAWESFLMAVR